MSYQVLARRWRPKTFAELVGQEHVVRALSNALENDRLHHAYLFTGTRGVGKTTIARILSKSLNCETGITATPCGVCSVCREVDEGRYVDLLEVDAASKTGVDDTRELLENVPYAPVRGRYKVYLIDEVHMFSNHSFNALLKTLEEPPPHVKFLLATTDPQKVPVTVLSRCLQFNLKRLPIEKIQGQLAHIMQAENIQADNDALNILARSADGSMRDGLSLLDQAIAFGGGAVKHDEVRDMLGIVATDQLPGLLTDVHLGDATGVLSKIEELAQTAPDFSGLLKDLMTLLHRINLIQATPTAVQDSWGDATALTQLAEQLTTEDSQLFYQIALLGQRDLPFAPDARSGFEMIMLRMLAFRPDEPAVMQSAPVKKERPVAAQVPQKVEPAVAPATSQAPAMPASSPQAEAAVSEQAPSVDTKPALQATSRADFSDWHQVLPRLQLKGMALQLGTHCVIEQFVDNQLSLSVGDSCVSLIGTRAEERLVDALQQFAGAKIKVSLQAGQVIDTPAQRDEQAKADKQMRAETDIASDPLVQAMQETFDAEVVEGSIRPVEH